jgi:hypothetical protein
VSVCVRVHKYICIYINTHTPTCTHMYICQEGKPFVEVQYMGGKKVFSPEEVCMSVCVCVCVCCVYKSGKTVFSPEEVCVCVCVRACVCQQET